MFNCDWKKLKLSFNDLHNTEEKVRPQYAEYCLLELKDGRHTAGAWYPYSDKENGDFSSGTAKSISIDQVAKWQALDIYDLTNCLEDENIEQINLEKEREDGYAVMIGDFKSFDDGDFPKNEQFCLLILKNGGLAAGRWNRYSENDGSFIYASALASYSMEKVWAWTELSPDELFLKEEARINAIKREEELNKNPTTDPVMFSCGTEIDTYYEMALKKLLKKYPWATLSQMKKKTPWKIVPCHGRYVFAQTEEGYAGMPIVKEWNKGSSAEEFVDFLCEYAEESVKNSNPKKKFKFGFEVEVYLEKAYQNVKKKYRWADYKKLRKACRFDIRQIDGDWEFVRIYDGNGGYSICDHSSAESFIESVEYTYREEALRGNPVVATYAVPFGRVEINGWYLERYIVSKLKSGDYKVNVQAGDRTTGGNREFFITPDCFETDDYEKFLDRYLEIIPGESFGICKKDLLSNVDFKKFLGY